MSIGAILPTAIFFGLAFPVGLPLWAGAAGTERHTAERVGLFYSVNVGAAGGCGSAGPSRIRRRGRRSHLMHVGTFDHLMRMLRASPRDSSAVIRP